MVEDEGRDLTAVDRSEQRAIDGPIVVTQSNCLVRSFWRQANLSL